MSNVTLNFRGQLTPSDPSRRPILIVGQVRNLAKVSYEIIKVKLEPRVNEEVSETLNFPQTYMMSDQVFKMQCYMNLDNQPQAFNKQTIGIQNGLI